jgi:hypothetical protein
MDEPPGSEPAWSDAQLVKAIAASRSWRGVIRELGLGVNSAGATRAIRRQATYLGLDTSHFTGQRTWSDATLVQAAPQARSWSQLLAALGVKSTSRAYQRRVKVHAARLGVDLSHLDDEAWKADYQPRPEPALANLRAAATMLAAGWFCLCGFDSAIPVEPAIYDLLVSMPDGIKRVQVKTTTYCSKNGWQVVVGRRPYSPGNRKGLVPYDSSQLDWFFIVDGDLSMYLIPSQVIAGKVGILLRTYTRYIVGNAAGLMTPRAA